MLSMIQEWSKEEGHSDDKYPVKRRNHVAACLGYGGQHPQLFISGGIDSSYKVLDDIWLWDPKSNKWKEV